MQMVNAILHGYVLAKQLILVRKAMPLPPWRTSDKVGFRNFTDMKKEQ